MESRKIKHKDISSLWEHNATHSHQSVFHSNNNRRHFRVWHKLNEKYHAKCIQTTVKSPVSVQVWGAIKHRGLSLLRKMKGNMDSAKNQSDIIHDIEMTCKFVVFPQKGYIFIHDLLTCHNIKSTRTFLECKECRKCKECKECKEIPILE